MEHPIRSAYGKRAQEYSDLLGSVGATAVEDQKLIARWAKTLRGPAIDAGCGPGHWTHYLHQCAVDITGIDLVAEFVDHAARHFPDVAFQVGDLEDLPSEDGTLGGILSWYSIIHAQPETVSAAFEEFSRTLRPGGSLLLGFFHGDALEPFNHAVTTAYLWPVGALQEKLENAGFTIEETHTRQDIGRRPHAAIWAQKA